MHNLPSLSIVALADPQSLLSASLHQKAQGQKPIQRNRKKAQSDQKIPLVLLRKRVFTKSPVRGLLGNWQSYRDQLESLKSALQNVFFILDYTDWLHDICVICG